MEANWKVMYSGLVTRGVLALLFGLLAVMQPSAILLILTLFLGAFFLLDGVVLVTAAFSSPFGGGFKLAALLAGFLLVWSALTIFGHPKLVALSLDYLLVYVLGFMALLSGVSSLVRGLRSGVYCLRWPLIFNGVISLLFALLLFASPGEGLLIKFIGFLAIFSGVSLLYLAVMLRKGMTGSGI